MTYSSGLFAATCAISSTLLCCAVLCCAVLWKCCVSLISYFFPSIDIQHTQCPCRFVILERRKLKLCCRQKKFETGICIGTTQSKIPGAYGILTHVASGLFSRCMAAKLLALSKSPVCTANRVDLCPIHISFCGFPFWSSVAGGACCSRGEARCTSMPRGTAIECGYPKIVTSQNAIFSGFTLRGMVSSLPRHDSRFPLSYAPVCMHASPCKPMCSITVSQYHSMTVSQTCFGV